MRVVLLMVGLCVPEIIGKIADKCAECSEVSFSGKVARVPVCNGCSICFTGSILMWPSRRYFAKISTEWTTRTPGPAQSYDSADQANFTLYRVTRMPVSDNPRKSLYDRLLKEFLYLAICDA